MRARAICVPAKTSQRASIPVSLGTARTIDIANILRRECKRTVEATERLHMSFNDMFNKKTEPHVDTPAQAQARADAAADVKAKADAKTAKAAAARAGKKT